MHPTSFSEMYVRKPLYVEAVQVTVENFLDITRWCFGEIKNKDETPVDLSQGPDPKNQYIQVRVANPKNPKQSKAYVGDWILFTKHGQGFKVYTPKAFYASFVKVEDEETEVPPEENQVDVEVPDEQDQTDT
jgi:hypothetical protein